MERKNKYSPSNTLPLYHKITSTNLQLKAENSIISSGLKKFEKHWKDSWTSWLQFVAIMTPCWVKHEHWPSLARSRTEEYYNISSIFPVWTPRDLTICSYSHITLNNFIKLEIYVQNLFILINFNVKVNYVEKLNLYCLNFIRDMRIQKIHLSSISFFLHFAFYLRSFTRSIHLNWGQISLSSWRSRNVQRILVVVFFQWWCLTGYLSLCQPSRQRAFLFH